jgi:glycerophosphoryl diester phosphodiesterase
MKIISHRGNLNGRNPSTENSILAINRALDYGFDVEIDVWYKNNNWHLGHDQPQYLIDESFLQSTRLWCHAKNLEALNLMLKNNKIHCFWHQNDDFTLTNKNYIWTYPGKKITTKSVLVVKNHTKQYLDLYKSNKLYGICTDYPLRLIS